MYLLPDIAIGIAAGLIAFRVMAHIQTKRLQRRNDENLRAYSNQLRETMQAAYAAGARDVTASFNHNKVKMPIIQRHPNERAEGLPGSPDPGA